jgi:hypothetical protein
MKKKKIIYLGFALGSILLIAEVFIYFNPLKEKPVTKDITVIPENGVEKIPSIEKGIIEKRKLLLLKANLSFRMIISFIL